MNYFREWGEPRCHFDFDLDHHLHDHVCSCCASPRWCCDRSSAIKTVSNTEQWWPHQRLICLPVAGGINGLYPPIAGAITLSWWLENWLKFLRGGWSPPPLSFMFHAICMGKHGTGDQLCFDAIEIGFVPSVLALSYAQLAVRTSTDLDRDSIMFSYFKTRWQ